LLVGGLNHVFAQSAPKARTAPPAATAPAPQAGVGEVTPPANPATDEQIHQYLALTAAEQAGHQVTAQMVKGMRSSAPAYLSQSFWDDVTAEFAKVDFVAAFTPMYKRYFSQDEMKGILAFYGSPAGKKLLAMQGPILRDTHDELQRIANQVTAAAYAKHKDEIDAAQKAAQGGGTPK
jgi:hypothetical protein